MRGQSHPGRRRRGRQTESPIRTTQTGRKKPKAARAISRPLFIWSVSKLAMSKPKIILCGENLPENVSDAEKILVESGIGVYQRDGKLVLVGNFPRHGDKPSLEFVTISKERLIDLFTTIITFEKQEGEEKKNVACPHYIAAIYLSREGEWRVPVIRQIITAPTMRPDG